MATVALGSFLTPDIIMAAPPRMRVALVSAAPAYVRREVRIVSREAWQEYVDKLHNEALVGKNRDLLPTKDGGVVSREWWETHGRPPIIAPWYFE